MTSSLGAPKPKAEHDSLLKDACNLGRGVRTIYNCAKGSKTNSFLTNSQEHFSSLGLDHSTLTLTGEADLNTFRLLSSLPINLAIKNIYLFIYLS